MNFKMLSTGILCCSIESLSLIVIELSSKVTTKETYFLGEQDSKYKVAVLDLGV